MTAHPAWAQSQYEKNRSEFLARVPGAPAEAIACRRRQGRVVREKQEGTPIMHFDDKKVIVVGGSAGMGRRGRGRYRRLRRQCGDRRTLALTHNLAIELAEHKIRVNAVAPAAVNTSALERWVPTDEIGSTLGTFAPLHSVGTSRHPRRRRWRRCLSALGGRQLGHRRDSQRRRRRRGRPQLNSQGTKEDPCHPNTTWQPEAVDTLTTRPRTSMDPQ
jgi:Enoyl-(Acyl carrier protein) reductase